MSDDIVSEVESVLFSTGRKMSVDELHEVTKHPKPAIKKALTKLVDEYGKKTGSLIMMEDAGTYKLTVKDKYIPIISKVVQRTELTPAVLETLAIIAFKYPILQSDVIKIRTNKAYEHIAELEGAGYIQRERYGRTKKIKLTQKFFDYFDIPEAKMKEAFARFEAVEDEIVEQEKDIADKEAEIKKKEAEATGEIEEEKEKVGPLETYDTIADDVGTNPKGVTDEELDVEVTKEKSKRGEKAELEHAISELNEMRENQVDPDAEALDIDNVRANGEEFDEGKYSLDDLDDKETDLSDSEDDLGTPGDSSGTGSTDDDSYSTYGSDPKEGDAEDTDTQNAEEKSDTKDTEAEDSEAEDTDAKPDDDSIEKMTEVEGDDPVDPFFDGSKTTEDGTANVGDVDGDVDGHLPEEVTMKEPDLEEDIMEDDGEDSIDDQVEDKDIFGRPDLNDADIKTNEKNRDAMLDDVYHEVEKNKDELTGKINKNSRPS